jgi:hypothetical protein
MNISIALRRAVLAVAEMKTLTTTVLVLGLMFIAASAARADTFACVNNSSGTSKFVTSCSVGTNASPCQHNDTCVDLSLSSGANESWESCDENICIDTPNPDGTGGWGHNVTTLTVGVNANLTVTATQLNPCSDGTITLTWRSQDFTYVSNGDTSASCSAAFSSIGPSSIEVCSYTDFGHGDKSDSFTFTPQNPTNKALVTATVHTTCNGEERASETFPVAIQP